MKIILNPQYEFLKDFITNLPDMFSQSGKAVYQARNKLKVFTINDLSINVKKYKVPNFINRIVYSFFRPSKAKRAYLYALHLLEKGIDTPAPVAYIEKQRNGLFYEGYFISLQSPYTHDFRNFWQGKVQGHEEILTAFALFTAQLHKNVILHKDYSPGNILYEKKHNEICFSLVDLNRMKFGYIDEDLGCHSFERLFDSEEILRFVVAVYASERGFDVKRCQDKVLIYHKRYMRYSKIKNIIKHPFFFLETSK